MTILAAQSIRWYKPVEPFIERTVINGKSAGLSHAGYDIRIAQDVYIPRGTTVLASSVEEFNMPPDLLAVVHDKSSWARLGVSVNNTVIEPGWKGFLTLELAYMPLYPDPLWDGDRQGITIKAGDPIAQIIFHKLDEETLTPYQGKYQNQPNRPVGAIAE